MALVFVGAAALTYALLRRPDDEARIRGQVAALADAVRIDAGERDPRARPRRIREAFRTSLAPEVQVDIADLVEDGHGRDELAGMAVSAAQTFGQLQVDFGDVRVEVDRPARRARVTAVATLAGTDLDGQPDREVRNVTLRLVDGDGEWRIASIETR
jgi:hypothetical protein